MAEFFQGTIPIYDDNDTDNLVGFSGASFGAVARDYDEFPETMMEHPSGIKLLDDSAMNALYDEREARKIGLRYLYLRGGKPAFQNLDQNGQGYCWMYSKVTAMMAVRMLNNNLPSHPLNAHAPACLVKKGRDEGGWCGLGFDVLRDRGCPTELTFPRHSMDYRLWNKPEVQEDAAQYRVTEDWYDLTRREWDQRMTERMIATVVMGNVPVAADFMEMAHSMCIIDWVRVEAGSWAPLVLNSWKDWGHYGTAVIRGRNGKANTAVAIRNVTSV